MLNICQVNSGKLIITKRSLITQGFPYETKRYQYNFARFFTSKLIITQKKPRITWLKKIKENQ